MPGPAFRGLPHSESEVYFVKSSTIGLVLRHAFIDGLCATGSASAPHPQEALAEPVAHIKTRLTEH